MKKVVFFLIVAMGCIAFTTPVLADDDDFKSFDLVFENVALTRGASADIHVKVFVNEDDDDGVTMLAVHGYAHTAATWEPLVKELFKKDDAVSRVIAIDLPGRGGSSFPAGLPYGVLILDDYVSTILNTLERLNRLDMFPSMVIGHSQGGLLIQIIQKTVEFGLQSFGIDQAVLLAPVPPDPLDWDFIDVAPTIIGGFGCFPGLPPSTPACLDVGFIGPHVAFPDSNWILLFFTNTDGEVASGSPTTDEVGQCTRTALCQLKLYWPVPRGFAFSTTSTSVRSRRYFRTGKRYVPGCSRFSKRYCCFSEQSRGGL